MKRYIRLISMVFTVCFSAGVLLGAADFLISGEADIFAEENESTSDEVCLSPAAKQENEKEEWEELLVLATAYTAGPESTGKTPEHPAYGITKTGAKALEGRTIAVDPDVIPLGSEVKIPKLSSYTYVAEDTGGKIKGRRIDIYMDSLDDALNWGARWVKVRYKKPEEGV